MIVVVELQGGRAVRRMGRRVARRVLPVDEQDVRVSVVVVINERTARTHRLRQPFLSEGSIVVREVNARLGSDVAEGNGLRFGSCG